MKEGRREIVTNTVLQERNLASEVGKTLLEPALDCAHASVTFRERMEDEEPKVKNEVEAILSSLFDPRPAYGEPLAADHRYLEYSEATKKDGTIVSNYRIKPGAVEADLESLELLKGRHPDLRNEFNAVMTSLHAYARRDDRMVVRDKVGRKCSSASAPALGKTGGTGGVMVTGFLAAASGTMAIINLLRGKGNIRDFVIPCFYGAIATLCYKSNLTPSDGSVKPNVSDTILDSTLTRALAPVDKALNKSGFTNIARTYSIEGTEWATIIESLMNADRVRDTLLAKVKGGDASQEDIDDYIAGVTTDPAIQNNMRVMIENGSYAHLVKTFSGIKEPQAKEVIKKYVEFGVWKEAR